MGNSEALDSFGVSAIAWTILYTVCVDPPWDDIEDLVEIT